MAINKAILIGNLGAKPEVRYVSQDRPVATFNLATTETYKNKEGQRVDSTEWHSIEMWDGLARIADQYLDKGSKVYIEGKIKTDKWEDKETGQPKSRTKILALNMTMLSPRNETNQSSSSESAPDANAYDDSSDGDLPF